ncbi:MAG TPA: DUF4124 domain-containing protein [Burkholderiales bacterium]
MAAALACAGAQARAETFKWVDERGVVNYSNQPSPGKTVSSTVVEDRISTYQSPPLHAVALNRAPDYEWLQRQRIMAEMAAAKAAAADCSYRVDCRDPYLTGYGYPLVPVVVTRRAHRLLRTSHPFR